jgi:hypothetical protein
VTALPEGKALIGRLALRQEKDLWVAYYAHPDTMELAVFLGSIAIAFVDGKPERKDAFIGLMREAVADILQGITGTRPTWGGLVNAPEKDRGVKP